MSFMSFGALTCFVGYLNFSPNKSISNDELDAPLRRAHRDNRNEYIICYIWSPESRYINSVSKPS
jgi:hypothetical protein